MKIKMGERERNETERERDEIERVAEERERKRRRQSGAAAHGSGSSGGGDFSVRLTSPVTNPTAAVMIFQVSVRLFEALVQQVNRGSGGCFSPGPDMVRVHSLKIWFGFGLFRVFYGTTVRAGQGWSDLVNFDQHVARILGSVRSRFGLAAVNRSK
ncbi:hypothetical protein Hdeb2414_s0002g00057711 [Helianthus debilis subsp. tardiflorus]